MTIDLRTAAKMEYQERMKQRLAGMPTPLDYLIMSGQTVKQSDLDAISKNKNDYENRERIPEPLLVYADLYHELTGQEPTNRSFSDWVDTFEAWRGEKLHPDNIRMAWAQAQSDKGFPVGRPGALTITAVGMKSKAKPALPTINTEAIERTQDIIEEKIKLEDKFVPQPDDLRAALRAKLAQKKAGRK